jgi:hypothetical protein
MKKIILLFLVLNFSTTLIEAQNLVWQSFTDSIPTLSSPRATDLNNDGIKDIVIGGGTDGFYSNSGIMAFNGLDGSLLWKRPSRNEVFGSPVFRDINNDGTDEVFIAGRSAQLLCINGLNGNLIWDYFPYGTNPADSGLYNFYNPQFIDDVDGDNLPDILVSNGGDHAAPVWVTNRPPGRLMVISSANGNLITQSIVPDNAEIYCSPTVIELKNDGNKWILYGTGGETLGGSFWACKLSDFLLDSLQNSVQLLVDPNKGYIAPASVFRLNDGTYDIVVQSFGGKISRIRGRDFTELWSKQILGSESSAAPVIGNFTGSSTPDVFAVLSKGVTSSYTDFYQVMIDGETGNIAFMDSLGTIHFASANALDLNNDGRDEALISLTHFDNGSFKHKLHSINFVNNQITQIGTTQGGVNFASTPLIDDIDANDTLDLIFAFKKDSLNPSTFKGIYVSRLNLQITMPNSGIAWGSYMGNKFNGVYNYLPQSCGQGSVVAYPLLNNPWCNGYNTGSISLVMTDTLATHTFVWSNGRMTQNNSGLTAGNYILIVTNDQGCFEELRYTISDPFIISFGGISPVFCPTDSNGTATLNSSGCQCQFSTCTFLWDNGVTTKPNTSLNGGWNYVTITHMNGCPVVDSVFIPSTDNIGPLLTVPADITVFTDPGSCGASNLVLGTATATDNCSATILRNNAPSTFNIGATQVLWTATDANGNSTVALQTVTVVDNQVPDIVCPVDLTIPANNSGCSANVNLPVPNIIDNCVATYASSHQNGSVFSLGTTQVTYIATDAAGNADTCSFNVTVVNDLQVNANGTNLSCNADNSGEITLAINGGNAPYNYTWTDGNTFNSNAQNINNLSAGNYFVTITDNNNCSFSTSAAITEPTIMSGQTSSMPETIGNDGSIDLNVNGGTSPYSYNWSGPNNFTASSEDLSALSAGSYNVTITDANGCVIILTETVGIVSSVSEAETTFYKLYPNPTNSDITIEFGNSDTYIIQIINQLGQIIFTKSVNSDKFSFNLKDLPAGIYNCKIKDNEATRTFETKIIKY